MPGRALCLFMLGVSVVPDSGPRGDDLRRVPFSGPGATRQLVLLTRAQTHKARLIEALHAAFLEPAAPV